VSRKVKVGIGLAIVALLALLAASRVDLVVGVAVLIVGVAAVVVLLWRTRESGTNDRPRLRRRKEDASPLDGVLGTATGEADVEPLQAWSPPPDLQAWTPPADVLAPPDPQGELVEEPADGIWAAEIDWTDTAAIADTNPLHEIDGLDEVDVVAEVERIEARESGARAEAADRAEAERATTSLFSAPAPVIKEEVSSADDIMAASQATEVEPEDNSELAKLLAKVHARLAAYE
jgi:hypothetical protein